MEKPPMPEELRKLEEARKPEELTEKEKKEIDLMITEVDKKIINQGYEDARAIGQEPGQEGDNLRSAGELAENIVKSELADSEEYSLEELAEALGVKDPKNIEADIQELIKEDFLELRGEKYVVNAESEMFIALDRIIGRIAK